MKIMESYKTKMLRSKSYNYNFDKISGYFERWGKTKEDDPNFSPNGPEILDLEISTSVRPEYEANYDKSRLVYDGGCLGACDFCYKSNGHYPTYNMNLDEFKTILNKMPKTLTQIAFGILNIKSNPDFFSMMEYSKEQGIIPNYTCHGYDVTDEVAKRTSKLCGAVAVSIYNKNASYNAIKKFTDNGMDQVNIHYMISEETYDKAFEVMDDMKYDDRLMAMNAIVFLSLKTKGGGKNFHQLSTAKYNKIVEYALEKGIPFGFDSCGAHRFLNAVKDNENYKSFETMAEPCESSCFSSYINCKGEYFACSFAEGHDMFSKGLDVLGSNDFINSVWNGKETENFRDVLLEQERHCPLYKIG